MPEGVERIGLGEGAGVAGATRIGFEEAAGVGGVEVEASRSRGATPAGAIVGLALGFCLLRAFDLAFGFLFALIALPISAPAARAGPAPGRRSPTRARPPAPRSPRRRSAR